MATIELEADQVQYFAEALYHLATVDGVHENEISLIKTFLKEAGHNANIDGLGKEDFDMTMLPWTFQTGFLRRIFLKTCVALVKADHEISENEQGLLASYADELGLLHELATFKADIRSDALNA